MAKLKLLKRIKPLPGEEDDQDIDDTSSKKIMANLEAANNEILCSIALKVKTYTCEECDQDFLESLIPKR